MKRGHHSKRNIGILSKFIACVMDCASLIVCSPLQADGNEPAWKPSTIEWQDIRQLATDFVARESPESVWPFTRASLDDLHRAPRKIFAHYFTPFPLSVENGAPASDYYAREFLKRSGENNKYFKMGGYLRERPLPIPPWPHSRWREINLAIEVLRANLIGLDGFGIDLLQVEGVLWDRTLMLYDVAAAVAPDFHIVAEPDMASLKDITEPQLAAALAQLLAHPAAYRLSDGRYLVVPFFAEGKPPEFWRQLEKDLAARGLPIALIPDFINPAGKADYAAFSYGCSYWGLRDPIAVVRHPAEQAFSSAFDPDHLALMIPMAPQDERPKDAILWEAHNTTLFRLLWTQAIAGRAQYAHLITWNDYSEASEVSPSTGTQFVFYDLAAFYAQWFKLGHAPAIDRDALFYTHRRQIMSPGLRFQPEDMPFQVKGLTSLSNQIEMIAFLKSPARLEIEIGGQKFEKEGNAGLNLFYITAQVGRPIFRILRDKVIVEKSGDWDIAGHPDSQDPLYAGGSSLRPLVPEVSPSP